MANIRKRGNKFQVQVRRVGSKSYTKTFSRITEARAWARSQEVNIDRDEAGFCKPLTIPLRDLLKRYLQEITPQKKSKDSEARRISRLLVTQFPRQGYATYRLLFLRHFETKDCSMASELQDMTYRLLGIQLILLRWSGAS